MNGCHHDKSAGKNVSNNKENKANFVCLLNDFPHVVYNVLQKHIMSQSCLNKGTPK